jgi:hypothetical protein
MSEIKSKVEKGWEKVRELRKAQQPVFDALDVPQAMYCPKMFYTPSGKSELYVSFFITELQRGQDIYTEMVSRDYNSEDNSRTLYRWNYNELWKTQYESTGTTPERYLIPVSELEKVTIGEEPEEEPDLDEDDFPISDMSIRDFAAIMWLRPISRHTWLNDLIKKGVTNG